jgi:gluconate:H+ symporter, GntP family
MFLLILPLVFIGVGNLSNFVSHPALREILKVMGNPIVAISAGLILGFLSKRNDQKLIQQSFVKGIEIAGPILILTGAGAGFGNILKKANLEVIFEHFTMASNHPQIWLLICFGLAAFFKTAQGSSTSSMIISASMIFPILPEELKSTPSFTALCATAIGSGAMVISHTNDSYFWIVKEFSNLSISSALKNFSIMTALMGVIGLGATLALSIFL